MAVGHIMEGNENTTRYKNCCLLSLPTEMSHIVEGVTPRPPTPQLVTYFERLLHGRFWFRNPESKSGSFENIRHRLECIAQIVLSRDTSVTQAASFRTVV